MISSNIQEQNEYRSVIDKKINTSDINIQKLVNLLFKQVWQHHCSIFDDRNTDNRNSVKIGYYNGKNWGFLRYSNGPLQGYFWDIYGDEFNSPEVALLAISNAPAPPYVEKWHLVPTHGN